jgi:prolyl oligopeptidase
MFEYIKGYSPVHNVKGELTIQLLWWPREIDDRVVPAHSFKFAAELQENKQEMIQWIRIDVKAGHGAGKSLAATIQENVDIQAFTLYNMGFKRITKS